MINSIKRAHRDLMEFMVAAILIVAAIVAGIIIYLPYLMFWGIPSLIFDTTAMIVRGKR